MNILEVQGSEKALKVALMFESINEIKQISIGCITSRILYVQSP